MKADDIEDIQNPANQSSVLRIEVQPGPIAFVAECVVHRDTPIFVGKKAAAINRLRLDGLIPWIDERHTRRNVGRGITGRY